VANNINIRYRTLYLQPLRVLALNILFHFWYGISLSNFPSVFCAVIQGCVRNCFFERPSRGSSPSETLKQCSVVGPDPNWFRRSGSKKTKIDLRRYKQCCGSETKVSNPISDPDPACS
jgi:hypothetical protein